MAASRVRMFAGPNGSGKSELIQRLQQSDLPLGPVVNADIIFSELQNSRYLDLHEFNRFGITQHAWVLALREIDELTSRVQKAGKVPDLEINDDLLIYEGNELDAYVAALIADFVRYMMLEHRLNFSFETVMSH